MEIIRFVIPCIYVVCDWSNFVSLLPRSCHELECGGRRSAHDEDPGLGNGLRFEFSGMPQAKFDAWKKAIKDQAIKSYKKYAPNNVSKERAAAWVEENLTFHHSPN